MLKRFAMSAVILTFATTASVSCDITYDPVPTWEQLIDEADVVFIGRVTEATPESDAGWGRAVFAVERWIKGGEGPQFEAGNGSGSNCVAEFTVGAHVVFGGRTLVSDDGHSVVLGEDTGHDAMVWLDEPPTPEQQTQLDYLNTLAPSQ